MCKRIPVFVNNVRIFYPVKVKGKSNYLGALFTGGAVHAWDTVHA